LETPLLETPLLKTPLFCPARTYVPGTPPRRPPPPGLASIPTEKNMTTSPVLHLIKLAPGVRDIETLETWIERARRVNAARGPGDVVTLTTRAYPARAAQILGGGSLYWVFDGHVRARQVVLGLNRIGTEEGRGCCRITLAPTLVLTDTVPRAPFRGWRYLDPAEAPVDLPSPGETGVEMPEAMRRELRSLGVI